MSEHSAHTFQQQSLIGLFAWKRWQLKKNDSFMGFLMASESPCLYTKFKI
jgi:hypothetical protein